MRHMVDFSLRYNQILKVQQEQKEYLIAHSYDVQSSLYGAHIQAQKLSVLCPSAEDEALLACILDMVKKGIHTEHAIRPKDKNREEC